MKVRGLSQFFALFLIVVFLTGCTIVLQKGRRSDMDRIESLEEEVDELKNARMLLEERLAQELKDKQVSVKMEDKGLVISFIAEVLFDSGKAKLREESFPILNKVIDNLEKGTFFAKLVLKTGEGKELRVDARPSDAIALALRAEVPIFVEEEVLSLSVT